MLGTSTLFFIYSGRVSSTSVVTSAFLSFSTFISFYICRQTKKDIEHAQNTIMYLNLEWWENYKDDILTQHLKDLYESNYDLKNAELKIKENEKLVKMQFADELPQLSFDGYIARTFRSSIQRYGNMVIPSYAQNNFQLPLTASYEIDIWGKNRLKTKSTEQYLEMVKQAERATYIALTSDFAAEYFNLIKCDKLLSIQKELIAIQEEIVAKTEDKYSAGLATINDLIAEQKMLTVLKEEKNSIEKNQEVLINNLRVYLAKSDGDVERADFNKIILLENIPQEINSDIIENRPDFLQQEANIKRAGYDAKVAKRELLPSIVIFGQIGFNAYRLNRLVNSSSQLFNAGIMPSLDIFAGGRKMAFLKLRKYQYDEALNDYQKTILEDIKELNISLHEYKTAKKNYEESLARLNLQDKTYRLMTDKKDIGSASELDVLYNRESLLLTTKEEVSNKINCLISTITLYKATGGKNLYETAANI